MRTSFLSSGLSLRRARWEPAFVAAISARILSHILIAWGIWSAGSAFWGDVARVRGGLLPIGVFVLIFIVFALRAVRRLQHKPGIGKDGIRFAGKRPELYFPAASLLELHPVSEWEIGWQIALPNIPNRLLTLDCSLKNWWCIRNAAGKWYFQGGDAQAIKDLANGIPASPGVPPGQFRDASGRQAQDMDAAGDIAGLQPFRLPNAWWEISLVIALVYLMPPLIVLLAPYLLYSWGWKNFNGMRLRLGWKKLQAQLEAGIQPEIMQHQPDAATARPARRGMVRVVQAPGFLLLLPLRIALFIIQKAAWLIISLGRILVFFLKVPKWLSVKIPMLVLMASSKLPKALGIAQKIFPVLFATLAGWVIAVWLALPLTALFADPYSQAWKDPLLVRGFLIISGKDRRASLATAMLEKAYDAKDKASMQAVLLAGAQNGEFHVSGWNKNDLPYEGAFRVTPPAMPGIRMVLDDKLDRAELLQASFEALPPSSKAKNIDVAIDAFRRHGGSLDILTAVSSGDARLVEFALETSGQLEARDWQGRTPLLAALDFAAEWNAPILEHVRYDNKNSPAKNLRALDFPGNADFFRAQYLDIAMRLVKHGADMKAQDRAGRSAAYLALQAGMPVDELEPYLKAVSPRVRTQSGAGLVHAAAAGGDVAALERVIKMGADINARTLDGRTAMHFAKGGSMVRALFRMGLNTDEQDVRGRSPLHYAVMRREGETAIALANLMQNPSAPDRFGRAALAYLPPDMLRAEASMDKPADKSSQVWRELELEIEQRKGN